MPDSNDTRKKYRTATRDLAGAETAATNPEGARTMTSDNAQEPIVLTAFEAALHEALERIVAMQPDPLPPGLNIRHRDDGSGLIDVLSRGRVIGAVSRDALLTRAAELEAGVDRDYVN